MTRPAPNTLDTLDALRAGIDAIDGEIMTLLAERLAHVDRVTQIKARDGVSAAAPTRFAAVVAGVRDKAAQAGFDPDIAETLWRGMIAALIEREQKVLGTEGEDA